MVNTKIPRYQREDVRFGTDDRGPVNSEVVTRDMTTEEYDRYFGGENMMTKEEYIKLKESGQTDKMIRETRKMDHNSLHKLKETWGLIGKFNMNRKDDQPKESPKVEEDAEVAESKAEPVTQFFNNKEITEKTAQYTIDPFRSAALEIADTLSRKNSDYGGSFGKLYREFGDLSVAIRLADKLERFKSLISKDQQVNDESVDDTLRDFAGYAILALIQRGATHAETTETES